MCFPTFCHFTNLSTAGAVFNQICTHLFHSSNIPSGPFFPSSASASPFYNSFHSKDNFQSNLSTSSPSFQYLPRPFLSCVFNSSPFYNIKDNFYSNLYTCSPFFKSFPMCFSTFRLFQQLYAHQGQFSFKSVIDLSILPIFSQALFIMCSFNIS